MILNVLMVGLGGACGAVLRYSVVLWIPTVTFPYSTLMVNTLGSLCIGLAYGYLKESSWPVPLILFVITGALGAFTTFSTYIYEFATLFSKQSSHAFLYLALSHILGILAFYIGFSLKG